MEDQLNPVKKQRKIIYPIIIFLVLSFLFFGLFNLENFLHKIENRLISALEKSFNGQVSVAELSYFPFNNVILENVEIRLDSSGEERGSLILTKAVIKLTLEDLWAKKDWKEKIKITGINVRGFELEYNLASNTDFLKESSPGNSLAVLHNLPHNLPDEISFSEGKILLRQVRESRPVILEIKNLSGKARKTEPGIFDFELKGKKAIFDQVNLFVQGQLGSDNYVKASLKNAGIKELNKLEELAVFWGYEKLPIPSGVDLYDGFIDLDFSFKEGNRQLFSVDLHLHGLKGSIDRDLIVSGLDNVPGELLDFAGLEGRQKANFTVEGNLNWGSGNLKFKDVKGELASLGFALDGDYLYSEGFFDLKLGLENVPLKPFARETAPEVLAGFRERTGLDVKNTLGIEELLNFKGNVSLVILGSMEEPQIKGDLVFPAAYSSEKERGFQASFTIRKDMFYLNNFEFKAGKGLLQLNGLASLTGQKDYYFDFAAEGFDVSSLELEKSSFLSRLKGNLNISALVTGKGTSPESLSIMGKAELNEPVIGSLAGNILRTDFWVRGRDISIRGGRFSGPRGELVFKGSVNPDGEYLLNLELTKGDTGYVLDLVSKAKKVDSSVLKRLENELPAQFSFTGEIAGKGTEPVLAGKMSFGEQGEFSLKITPKQLEVQEGWLLSSFFGRADFSGFYRPAESFLGASIILDNVSPRSLKPFFEDNKEITLPQFIDQEDLFSSDIHFNNAEIFISGPVSNPLVRASVELKNSSPKEQSKTKWSSFYKTFKDGMIQLSYDHPGRLKITSLHLNFTGGGSISGRGSILPEMDLMLFGRDFRAEDFVSGVKDLQSLRGLIDFQIKTKESSPEIKGRFWLADLFWQGISLGEGEISAALSDGKVSIDEYIIKKEDLKVSGKGVINSDFSGWRLEAACEGYLPEQILSRLPYGIRHAVENQKLEGSALIHGSQEEVSCDLDLVLEEIKVSGSISSHELDIELSGALDLARIARGFEWPVEIEAQSSVTGRLSGTIENPQLLVSHSTKNGSLNGKKIEQLQGEVNLKNGNLYISETVELEGENSFKLAGTLPWQEEEKLKLNLEGDFTGIGEMFSGLPGIKDLTSTGDLRIKIEGEPKNPDLTGQINFRDTLLHFSGFPYPFRKLNGTILLSDSKFEFIKMEGFYGRGSVFGMGSINFDNLLAGDSYRLDLSLWGQNIPFRYGSVNTLNDGVIHIRGYYLEPTISGYLKVHDGEVTMPWKWPQGSTGSFKPVFYLTLEPGRNLFLSGEGMNIPIQEGELVVDTTTGMLALGGELTTRRGTAVSYNNRFEIIEGSASFMKYISPLPYLNVQARTTIDDVEITVYLDGPVDKLDYRFSSNPELTETEIIHLLSSRGGLPSLLEGDFTTALNLEILRFFSQEISNRVLNRIENSLAEFFHLDQVDITTGLFLDERMQIKLGKYLEDGFYIVYSHDFTENPEQSIGFELEIHDMIIIEGSFSNTGDLRLGVNTEFTF